MAALRAKQQAFVYHYCSNGFNGTQAAISAGYSEKTAGSIADENLKKPAIAQEIDKFKASIAEKAEITVQDLVKELEEARVLAVSLELPSAMNQSTMGKAKLLGLEKDRHEHTGKDGQPIEHNFNLSVKFVGN